MTSAGEHHRHSIRVSGYDYSAAGGYFVTVVAFQRQCLFGEVVGGEMRLSALGRIVQEEWFKTTTLRPYVELREDEFVVMPNHLHGIIWILNDEGAVVGAQRRCAPTTGVTAINVVPRSLGAIVRAIKSAVTYRAGKELNISPIWQRNYFEHIIRNQEDYDSIAGYIIANPEMWGQDEENPTKG